MTIEEFKKKHKSNILLGFDDLDGMDVWKEFSADLDELLRAERNRCAEIAETSGFYDANADRAIAELIRRGRA